MAVQVGAGDGDGGLQPRGMGWQGMSTPDIRAALERLIELHNADGAWGLHWTNAIDAARAALAEPVGGGSEA